MSSQLARPCCAPGNARSARLALSPTYTGRKGGSRRASGTRMQNTAARAGGVQPSIANGPSKSCCAIRMVLFVMRLAHRLGEHHRAQAGLLFLVDRLEAGLVAARELARRGFALRRRGGEEKTSGGAGGRVASRAAWW